MIPEKGTREDFKLALFEASAIPLVGEVYRASPHGGTYRFGDIWHVKRVLKGRAKVIIDIYAVSLVSVTHDTSHKNVEMALYNWKRRFEAGEMRYVGDDIHTSVQEAWI